MSEITVSEQHKQAIELHQKIIVSANLAQQNIWDMCNGLKTMRDNKLYKELGYQNFEDYCENEVGMKRSNAYNYISIVEKINPENGPIDWTNWNDKTCSSCHHKRTRTG